MCSRVIHASGDSTFGDHAQSASCVIALAIGGSVHRKWDSLAVLANVAGLLESARETSGAGVSLVHARTGWSRMAKEVAT